VVKENILCLICARGGSQGLPGKNLLPLLGKPVITWAIQKAMAIPEINRVVVSTDSEKIAKAAKAAGADVPFVRPAEFSSSTAGKFQVWQHALQVCEQQNNIMYDLFIDIDCTNPLIEISDIEGTIQKFRKLREDGLKPDAVFTVSISRRNPYFNLVEPDMEGVLKMSKCDKAGLVLARQRAPAVFEHVAGVYVLTAKYLRSASHLLDGRAFGYQIPSERAFDIDSELDFSIIEFLFKKQRAL